MSERGVAIYKRGVVCIEFCLCRYWTPEIQQYLEVTMAAEEDKQVALKDTMRTVFYSFIQQ